MVRKLGWALASLLILSFSMLPATAFDNGQYGNVAPDIKAWFDSAHSVRTSNCCSLSDGLMEGATKPYLGTFVEWELRKSKPWVHLVPVGDHSKDPKGKWWFPVPDEALVLPSNKLGVKPPGFAVIWFFWTNKEDGVQVPEINCFQPGTGA